MGVAATAAHRPAIDEALDKKTSASSIQFSLVF